ncbi:MAG: flagellar protein FlaG [Phenylobacterium sp.]|uniref:flagellar protein FlaG n=1 Tax=Phenylobacterium sp. TaxID=1871053 RepID=UPI00391C86FF
MADLRLVIEENANTGTFVYKTIDRRTGEVVSQIPREEMLKLQQDEGYEAGAVIKTQA